MAKESKERNYTAEMHIANALWLRFGTFDKLEVTVIGNSLQIEAVKENVTKDDIESFLSEEIKLQNTNEFFNELMQNPTFVGFEETPFGMVLKTDNKNIQEFLDNHPLKDKFYEQ